MKFLDPIKLTNQIRQQRRGRNKAASARFQVNINILIAADIFGHTPALDQLAKRLAEKLPKSTIHIIDPYDGMTQFRDETKAYAFFTRTGILAYSKKIADRLGSDRKTGRQTQILIGFSVGASAIWQLSGDTSFAYIQQAIGFYGAQIRHHPEIRPVFDNRLVWPRSEPHFDGDRLILDLKETPRVSCYKTFGLHGFMNERSQNFDQHLYETWLEQLSSWVQEASHPSKN